MFALLPEDQHSQLLLFRVQWVFFYLIQTSTTLMNSLWILTIKLCIPWKIVGIEWISEQTNSVGLLLSSPPSLTQFKTYIWNNFSMSHLELVAETSPPDSLLSFQFLPLIMSSRLSLTLNLLRPWTNKWLALFILEDVSLLDPRTFPRVL